MWSPLTPQFLEALRYSHTFVSTMDVFNVGNDGLPQRVLSNVPVVDGAISCDRKSNTRRTLSAEVILEWPNDGYTNLVNSTNTRVQVWRGIQFADRVEKVPVGVFRIDSVEQRNKSSLSLTGTGLEIYVQENRFVAPYLPPYGRLATLEIKALIEESIPFVNVVIKNTSDYKVRKTTPWVRERWDAISELADAIVADVYCRPDGSFIIEDQPSLQYSPIQWVMDEGPRGVLVEVSQSRTRAGVYNAVTAQGTTNDTGIPVAAWTAYDLIPSSPTYWNGGFGHVPRFYESEFLYTNAQCKNVAESMLSEAHALDRTITFSSIPNPALEPGDAVMVAMLDGTFEKHVLQSFSIPLAGGGWQAATMALKADDDSGATMKAEMPAIARYLSDNVISREDMLRIPDMLEASRA